MTTSPLHDQPQDMTDTADARTPWLAPEVQVIAAGEAEVGTRSVRADGQFTTS